jgi:hypothetical protein
MMDFQSSSFIAGTFVATVVILATYARATRRRANRRATELQGAAHALALHYNALDAVADDPALPTGALEMLVNFSEGISDERFCDTFTNAVLTREINSKDRLPPWFGEIEQLRRTRPDVVENFNKAIGAGLAAAFLRWPGNSWKISVMAEAMSQGDMREAVMAQKLSDMHRSRGDHNDMGSGGGIAIPA